MEAWVPLGGGQEKRLFVEPDAAQDAVTTGVGAFLAPVEWDGVQTQVAVERDGGRGGLLEDVRRHGDQRRAALGDEGRDQDAAVAVHEVERAAVGVEDARGPLNDHAVQLGRAQSVGERRAETVQEVKDAAFLRAEIVQAALGGLQEPALPPPHVVKARCRQDEESEEQRRPHESIPSRKNPKSEAKTPSVFSSASFPE